MKKMKFTIAAVAVVMSLFLASCFNEEDAIDKLRSNELADSKVSYTVLLVDASKATTLKSGAAAEMLSNAMVTIVQDDSIYTKTTGTNGSVNFKNLQEGTIAVNVTKDDYADVSYIADISYQLPSVTGDAAVKPIGGTTASNMIAMIPVSGGTATIKGRVNYEADLTNKELEVATGVVVTAKVNSNSTALSPLDEGIIMQIAYSGLSLKASTDSIGQYELKVPSTTTGLTYTLTVDDFEADQTLYVEEYKGVKALTVADAEVVMPALFSSNADLTDLPEVPAGFAVVSAPESGTTGTGAVAVAVLEDKGAIASVSVSSNGIFPGNTEDGASFFLLKDGTIALDTANATLAKIELNYNGNSIDQIDVTAGGENYTDAVSVVIPNIVRTIDATILIDNGFDPYAGDAIANYQFVEIAPVEGRGIFLADAADLDGDGDVDNYEIQVVGQTSASDIHLAFSLRTRADADGDNDLYEINALDIDYAKCDTLSLADNGLKLNIVYVGGSAANAKMHAAGSQVVAIGITDGGDGYIEDEVYVELVGGNGEDATIDDANIEVTNGAITYIPVSTGGTGYSIAPSVRITAVPTRVAIIALSFDENGQFESYDIVDAGIGYLKPPTVSVAALNGGTGASMNTLIDGLGRVTTDSYLVNKGSGYYGGNYVSGSFAGSFNVTVSGTQTLVKNFNLQQGERTVED